MTSDTATHSPRPFTIAVDDAVLSDLTTRLERTRWPSPAPGAPWSQGADLGYLREIVTYWTEKFDWRAQERRLNTFAHHRTEIEDTRIHFVHHRAAHGEGIPLILTHGWPSTFAELLPLVPLLTDPGAHGIEGPAFDVVIPSLPGYCFSSRPDRALTMRDTARLWHTLMRGLGYERYGVQGGDFGSGIGTFLALDQPSAVRGLYLSNIELSPYLGPGAPPLTEAERAYLAQEERWLEEEGGYNHVQSTKPQSLAYALTDSPTGLAAWVLEKWRAWSDSGGDLESRFTRDFLLTTLTLLWVTDSIAPSLRDYHDNRELYDSLTATDHVQVPTAIGLFGNEYIDDGTPPRSWAERLYTVHHWTVMPSGGHFAPTEEPHHLAADLTRFFATL
uniref:IssA protein n=1 Tax=Streptomyces tenjimariensis TaxID=29308 RepID=Q2UZE5_9ACTN|nr:IssA protein [Streptomyces tenjimariensis]